MSNSSTGDQLDGEEENVNLNNQVYIGNISPDFDDQKLRTLLMTQSIHPTSLYIDPLEGFAYVELPDQESVTRLIDNFNGKSKYPHRPFRPIQTINGQLIPINDK